MNDYIINNAHFLKRARNIRNELLNKTDKYILSDYPITLDEQMKIKLYKEELRNHIKEAYDIWKDRHKIEWVIDLSIITDSNFTIL